ncbi:MAG: hypothetical protein ONB48_17975 [candidate division KSB1 bacterium]|nr:hypothetical protein [candidate division KSB1 bacterium]MDZ7275780.1 hypothetical protein [candidate division KSB1 bacterium]MDZ7287532.1 hypothetical protein [candidate division KSB1 bacterium]MDZ7307958.1 hypothetical protein [candidate division KSB1 bacterium]MDZ7350510.1 hypothetical protein [candidate division KSB1 bacterium]
MRKRLLLLMLLAAAAAFAQVAEGPQPQQLTAAGREFMQPVWSPTGEWIALTGPNYDGIWLIRPDGSGLEQLTGEVGVGYKMSWSSDGRFLAGRVTRRHNQRRQHALQVYDVATKTGTVISAERKRMPGVPQWVPGQGRLALWTGGRVEYFEVASAPQPEPPTAAPRPLVFATPQGVLVTGAGVTPRVVQPMAGEIINAELAPDGTRLVAEALGSRLFVCSLTGSDLVELGRGERPHWSPDGQKIGFMVSEDDGHRLQQADIYTVNPDGSGRVNVTATATQLEMNCSWSPDSRQLVYDERRSGAIWVMRWNRVRE